MLKNNSHSKLLRGNWLKMILSSCMFMYSLNSQLCALPLTLFRMVAAKNSQKRFSHRLQNFYFLAYDNFQILYRPQPRGCVNEVLDVELRCTVSDPNMLFGSHTKNSIKKWICHWCSPARFVATVALKAFTASDAATTCSPTNIS